MNCYNHPEITTVATCQNCGKGLCKNCSDKFNFPICIPCNIKRANTEKQEIKTEFVWMILAGIIGLFYSVSLFSQLFKQNIFLGLILLLFNIYVWIGIIAGWKTLNKLTSNYFLFLPLIGWAIYFLIKLIASIHVGFFVTPFRIIKKINRLKVLNNIQNVK